MANVIGEVKVQSLLGSFCCNLRLFSARWSYRAARNFDHIFKHVVFNPFHSATQFPTQGNLAARFGEQNFGDLQKKISTLDPSLIYLIRYKNFGDL